VALVRDHCRWENDGQPFFSGEVEPCLNGLTIALGAYFDQDVDRVVARLLGEQLEDGGWNCEVENGSVRSSFHTTIRVLEGLLAALNNVKGIALDARIPTCMLVGYFGRDVTRSARDNAARAVNLIEPTLDAWGVPYFPLEAPADLPAVRRAYQTSVEHQGPSVILVGAPTS
jgi:hypothetical protein